MSNLQEFQSKSKGIDFISIAYSIIEKCEGGNLFANRLLTLAHLVKKKDFKTIDAIITNQIEVEYSPPNKVSK